MIMIDQSISINSVAQDLAIKEEKKVKKSFEEIVPQVYHGFKSVFNKKSFDELPPCRIWDHAIELKPGSMPSAGKVYPLSLDEQKQLEVFLDENMASGRIFLSKSLMASFLLYQEEVR